MQGQDPISKHVLLPKTMALSYVHRFYYFTNPCHDFSELIELLLVEQGNWIKPIVFHQTNGDALLCLEQLKKQLYTKAYFALYRQETDLYTMSYLRAENGSYLIFISITQSPPSGTYSPVVNTCWITELNNECIITKFVFFFPTALFLHKCPYEYVNLCKLKLPTFTHPNCGVYGSGNHWKQRKIPTLLLSLCSGEQTTCINWLRHIPRGSKNLPCAPHFVFTVIMNGTETEVQLACSRPHKF